MVNKKEQRAASISMKLKKILSKYQKYLLGIALVLSSITISIKSSDGEINFVLHNHPVLIFLMVVVSSALVAIYFHINTRKIYNLSSQIKEHSKITNEGTEALLSGLTDRQWEVYDLTILGKSNKEIIAELFIEQSTLKSHINQIYKKLNIKSRSELKTNVNT